MIQLPAVQPTPRTHCSFPPHTPPTDPSINQSELLLVVAGLDQVRLERPDLALRQVA